MGGATGQIRVCGLTQDLRSLKGPSRHGGSNQLQVVRWELLRGPREIARRVSTHPSLVARG